jgi:predicted ATPase/DNA-binding CsgD family transcriptional regulator
MVAMPETSAVSVGNLPIEQTSFVGRRSELGEAKRLLAGSRLVTLTGMGGTGKTRLGMRLAVDVHRAFPDGVWLVDLTSVRAQGLLMLNLRDPDVLAYLVMITLGVRDQPGAGSPLGQLVRHLSDRHALLVLDNCEHLMPGCSILADTLLRGCPRLRIVATSRELLLISGEVVFPVPPLPTPQPDAPGELASLGRVDAVALFVARARVAAPGFTLTGDNAGVVVELCRRLDGLPLAIELAAARTATLSPAEILDRQAERFALLAQVGGPQRQSTLGACVDWSFELCGKAERLLWARLSVFAGGFELDAVEGICVDEAVPAEDVLEALVGLVDKSILVSEDVGGVNRYRMLETIRDYGYNKLTSWGEQLELQRRHRDWYVAFLRGFQEIWLGPDQVELFGRLDRELPNLRVAAQDTSADPEGVDDGLTAVCALAVYWTTRGLQTEARARLDEALARPGGSPMLRLDALYYSAVMAGMQGDVEAVSARKGQLHELGERLGNRHAQALDLLVAGHLAMMSGDLPEAGSRWQAVVDLLAGDETEEFLFWRLTGLSALASAKAALGDVDGATVCHEEILAICRPRREAMLAGFSLWALGLGLWRSGDLTSASVHLREALEAHGRLRSVVMVALCLDALAWISADEGRAERAATLIGAVNRLAHEMGMPPSVWLGVAAAHEQYEERTREALGVRAYQNAAARGAQLSVDEAIAYGLHEPDAGPVPSPRRPAQVLTRREREVAELVGKGLSNREIARSLVIGQRTVESHVEQILAKLGVTSRAQIAVWVAGQRPGSGDGT